MKIHTNSVTNEWQQGELVGALSEYDAIIIGAGHNGLTNAAFLAKAGLNTLLLEKNDYIGGAAVSRQLYEDWTYSNCSYVCSLLRPEIYRALDLGRHGLQIIPYGGGAVFTRDGKDYLGNYYDHEVQYREIKRHNARDADAYIRYSTDVMRYCRFIRPLLLRTPPDPTSLRPKDLGELFYMVKKFNELGPDAMYQFIRFFTMSVYDFLSEYFTSDIVKAKLAGSGIIGTALGPMSPGTAYVLLHHYMGDVDGNISAWGLARGGMGAITSAMASAFQAHGGELRASSEVAQILTKNGRACGVVLTSGEEIKAKTVVSNLDVKRTYLKLMGEAPLKEDFRTRVENFKIRGSSGKVNIALDGLPDFTAFPEGSPLIRGELHFNDTVEEIERAYDDWKENRWSTRPYLDLLIPSTNDPTMTPPGKHMVTAFVQYCPAELADGGWTPEKRETFGQNVINLISEYSPNFKDLILHTEVRTPQELEQEVGLTEGNIFQGELTLDQLLFNRPLPGYAQYRGPFKGLYMCGSATHPGGGVMAAPGANAAREILRDMKYPDLVPQDESYD